jgi:acylphosphatase
MTYRHYLISGRVQGVGFRNFVVRSANQNKQLLGWVRNLRDGRVECLAGGDETTLAEFERQLRKGPMLSQVTSVISEITFNPEHIESGFFEIDNAVVPWKEKAQTQNQSQNQAPSQTHQRKTQDRSASE